MERFDIEGDDGESGDWLYCEIENGVLTLMRWDGWRLRILLIEPPGELNILRSFLAWPGTYLPKQDRAALADLVDFDEARIGVLGSNPMVPWYVATCSDNGVEFLHRTGWSLLVPWETTWLELMRKLAAWSYLTGMLIPPTHIGEALMREWRASRRYIPIGKHPFLQFSLSPFWCQSMN